MSRSSCYDLCCGVWVQSWVQDWIIDSARRGFILRQLICQHGGINDGASGAARDCRTTEDLRAVFRRRVAQLNISLETLDAIAGLPTRYSSKVLGLQPTRRFGQISFEALLGALGLMLIASRTPKR